MKLTSETKVTVSPGRDEALTLGRAVGADWVIFGEMHLTGDFRVKKGLVPTIKKQMRAGIHLVVVDVQSGNVIYWVRLEDEARGSTTATGYRATQEDGAILRGLLVNLTGLAVDEVANAMQKPEKKIVPPVTREDLDRLLGDMGL
jgi:hypothetical protein